MAITINDQPDTFTPVYNPVVFTLDSTNNTQTNFKYVVDVYMEGSVNYDRRFLIPADPNNGYGKIDLSRYLKSKVTGVDISISATHVEEMPNSIKKLKVKVGEQFGTTPGTTADLATSNDFYVFNGAVKYKDYVNWNSGNYLLGSSNDKFLTNTPSTQRIASGEDAFLSAIVNTTGDAYYVIVRTFDDVDANGNLLGQYDIAYDGQALANTADRMFITPAGWNLNDIAAGDITVTSGALPILDADVKSYLVVVTTSTGITQLRSEVKYFNVINRDCRHSGNQFRLHYLNRLGGYDSFTFELVNKYNISKEVSEFRRERGVWSGTSYDFDRKTPQRAAFHTQTQTRYRLTSNWVTKAEYDALEELFDSPEAYYVDGSELVFCRVVNTNYEEKLEASDKLFNVEMEIEITYTDDRQGW